MIKENIHDLSYLLPCLKSLSFVCLNDSFLFEVWWLYFERGKWKSVCEVIQWKSKWKHKWKSKIIKQYYFIILRSPPKVQIYTNITILLLAGYYIVTNMWLFYYCFCIINCFSHYYPTITTLLLAVTGSATDSLLVFTIF